MRTRLILDLCLLVLIGVTLSMPALAIAPNLEDPEANELPTVEIEYAPELLLPYHDRRPDWSGTAALRLQRYSPLSYKSEIDGSKYSALFGDRAILLTGLRGGLKYNTSLLSIVGELSYESGAIADDKIGDTVNLQVTRAGGHIGAWFDMIWKEPYLVPYVDVSLEQVTYRETDSSFKSTGTCAPAVGFSAGALVQLNWLDESASTRALVEAGLNNSYLDLFVTQASKGSSGPSFETEIDFGAGLRLEF